MAKRKKRIAVSRYDSADYLKTAQDVAAYLNACLREAPDDASYLAAALGAAVRALELRFEVKATELRMR